MDNTDQFYYVEVPRRKVQIIDKLVELSKNSGTTIESQKDWEIVEKLFEFFKLEFPEDYQYFLIGIAQMKSNYNYGKAFIKEGESMIQHQMEIPEKFAELIYAIFPDQKFDRDFVRGLAKTLPILKVASSI
jgi:hypothetical protein